MPSLNESSAYWAWSEEDAKKYHSVVPVFAHSKCYARLEEAGLPPWIGESQKISLADYISMLQTSHPSGVKVFDFSLPKEDPGQPN
jgi:hypothetical protein